MMMWVKLLERAYSAIVSATSWPGSVTVSAPSRCASRIASAIRSRSASLRLRSRPVSTCTAVQGAFRLSAMRLAWRTTSVLLASPPMQARMRSPAAHGPEIACACM